MSFIKGNERILAATVLLFLLAAAHSGRAESAELPGSRRLLDAHNCYPYGEWWGDRIDRALSTGLPLAIEQDLVWYAPQGEKGRSVLSHELSPTGHEPQMEQYFFERIRPLVERALASNDRSEWPLITLNLDFKTEEPEHLQAVHALLESHKDWLTSAVKVSDVGRRQSLDVKPILVLVGPSAIQQRIFHDEIAMGQRILAFGAIGKQLGEGASNYRRWINYSWRAVESEGQSNAREFSTEARARLSRLVQQAHAEQLWIRFYTLDGASDAERSANGWYRTYSFRSLELARIRWQAAAEAGVDYISTDQYAELATLLAAGGN